MKYSDAWLAKACKFWDGSSLSYCDREVKIDAHKRASRVLQSFATDYLKLEKGEYDIRSNMAGVACSGEVTLHTNPFGTMPLGIYIQIGQHSFGGTILFRACKNMADYSGFANNWTSMTHAFGTREGCERFVDTVHSLCSIEEQPRVAFHAVGFQG